ncbi:MAG: hypothetical protein ACXAB0_13265 [Candidatus Thorarchaeota archaeon]
MKYDYGSVVFQNDGIPVFFRVELGSDQNYLYCFSGGEATIWDKTTFRRIATVVAPHTSRHIASDDSFLYAGESVWDKNDWSHLHSFNKLGWTGFEVDKDHLIFRCHDMIRVFEKGSWREVTQFRNIEAFRDSVASDNEFLYFNGKSDKGRGHIFVFSKDDWSKLNQHRVNRNDIMKLIVDEEYLYYLGLNHGVGIIKKEGLDSETEYEQVTVLKDYYDTSDFTMNDRYIFTSSGQLTSGKKSEIRIWDKDSFDMVESLTFDNQIEGLVADNDYLYYAIREKGIMVIDKNWEQAAQILHAEDTVTALEIGEHNAYSGHRNGQIKVLSPSEIRVTHSLNATSPLLDVVSDNRFLYGISELYPSKIFIWKIEDFTELPQLYGEFEWLLEYKYGDYVYGLRDKDTLAFLSKTNPDKWYEMTLPWENELDFSSLKSVYIEGDIIYLGHKWGIIIWNTAFSNIVDELDTDRNKVSMMRTDSNHIYALAPKNLYVWSRKHRKRTTILKGQQGRDKWLEVGEKHVYLALDLPHDAGSIVQVWEKGKWSKTTDLRGFTNKVVSVKEDGQTLKTIEETGEIKTWLIGSWKCETPESVSDVSLKWTSGTILAFPVETASDRFKEEYSRVMEFKQPLVMRRAHASWVIDQDYLKNNLKKYQKHLDNVRRVL